MNCKPYTYILHSECPKCGGVNIELGNSSDSTLWCICGDCGYYGKDFDVEWEETKGDSLETIKELRNEIEEQKKTMRTLIEIGRMDNKRIKKLREKLLECDTELSNPILRNVGKACEPKIGLWSLDQKFSKEIESLEARIEKLEVSAREYMKASNEEKKGKKKCNINH